MIMQFIPWLASRSRQSHRVLCQRLALPWCRYQRWKQESRKPAAAAVPARLPRADAPLAEEIDAVLTYALEHPQEGYRPLTWRMIDEDVAYLSESSVYRILAERDLLQRWAPPVRRHGQVPARAVQPQQRWHTDIMYLRVGDVWYFLVSFLDAYSRYIVHWELLPRMKDEDITLATHAALEKYPGVRPEIVSDHGCQYTSREYKKLIRRFELNHILCRVGHPQSNGLLERYHRTTRAALDATDLRNLYQARDVIAGWVEEYNERRLHAGLKYIEPAEYFRGNPAERMEHRRQKLQAGREKRIAANLGWTKSRTPKASYPQPSSPLRRACSASLPILAAPTSMDNSYGLEKSPVLKTAIGIT